MLTREITIMLFFSIITVTIVILFITANLFMSLIVLLLVILVLLYMTGLCYYWGLTMNNFVAVNLSFALGISIDYSVHIAHKYLTIIPPANLKTIKEKREYKISKAVSAMGSSVFHGGFSTFLAISSMFGAKVYYIQVFFKTWCCFIVCGLINGIILQPVLLSFIGPVYTTNAKENKNDE